MTDFKEGDRVKVREFEAVVRYVGDFGDFLHMELTGGDVAAVPTSLAELIAEPLKAGGTVNGRDPAPSFTAM